VTDTVGAAVGGGAGNFAMAGAEAGAMISPGVGPFDGFDVLTAGKLRAGGGALTTGAGVAGAWATTGAAATVGLSTAGAWTTTGAAGRRSK